MHKFRISQIIRQPNDNITIAFDDPTKEFPPYLAGQFLTLAFDFNGRQVRRSYSFSSSPEVDEPISITVKRVDNGEISRLLHHRTAVGDTIEVLAAQGLLAYTPEDSVPKTLFLFAAGVGVTPLFSILKTALVAEPDTKVVLVYSNSSPEKTLFLDELRSWQAKYPDRLHIEWIFSNSKHLLTARLNREYIIRLIQQYRDADKQTAIYLCGPVFYMDLCRFTLLGMGFPDETIHRETFFFPEEEADEDEREEEEQDTSTYQVILKFQGENYDLLVPYNKTILDVGLAQKIKLPYSCKSGMCSTCISQVHAGSVRMSYNEVLTDREVDNGRCLICTSHPLENGSVIEVL
ncbi:ferredoxin--NADP reductase [Sphingobacterium sp. lm-10]|uniref:ferredoxin--NADP reductase n=1 Tax=Sphingobacterium sp. lm-10 TaxID=2944904 RepID=UPI002021A815|nr:ferredoxin--NADP reductase [Sphingobacterium sp. lm-10]MCL7986425.1 ferredoxin--NADP reductase [Sphingobacterium sp. lm-10]